MRTIFVIGALFFSSICFAQNKITGKWKPVFLSMGKILTADIKADTVFLSDSIDVILKDDKDPKGSKELMQMVAEAMLQKMKTLEQEFSPAGVYTETDTRRNTSKNGTYTFDATTNVLITTLGNSIAKYTVSFKKDHMMLTGEVGSNPDKRGTVIIEYEKI